MCFLSRRYANYVQIPGGVHGKHPVFKNTDFIINQEKSQLPPCSVFNLPVVLHQSKNNGFVSSSREGQPYCQSLPKCFAQELSSLAVKIWTWCLHIWISVAFLPGVKNVVADEMARNFNDRTEWHLLPEMDIVQELDFSRSVCVAAEQTTPQIRIVASRPTSMAGGCIHHQLEQLGRLCFFHSLFSQ